MEKEYVSFAFEKNKRVEYFTELIDMFNLPFTGWEWLSYPYKNIFKTSVAGKRKKQY